jgi:SEC-C motif-containing protein
MQETKTNEGPCPCSSGKAMDVCCGPFLAGAAAPTAEALMRSRYTAYVLARGDYLLATWHASTRPAHWDGAAGPHWLGLEIRAVTAGTAADTQGTVEFVARYRDRGRVGALHETSRFVREEGRWYYVDGTIHPAATGKVGRNDSCPCGSGRKFKHCCG